MQRKTSHATCSTEFRDPDPAHASGQAAACGEGGEGSFVGALRRATTPRAALDAGNAFVAANLRECCAEVLEWQTTSILRDGKLRKAAAFFYKVSPTDALQLAESATTKAAMRAIVASTPHVGTMTEAQDAEPVQVATNLIDRAALQKDLPPTLSVQGASGVVDRAAVQGEG
jgi:hypothetical protein